MAHCGRMKEGVRRSCIGLSRAATMVRPEGDDNGQGIGINLSREVGQEARRSVGARAVGSGWEGLDGRPWGRWDRVPARLEPREQDACDHQGPPLHPSATLAPTRRPNLLRDVRAY